MSKEAATSDRGKKRRPKNKTTFRRRRSVEQDNDPTDAHDMASNYAALRLRADSSGSTRRAFGEAGCENTGFDPYHQPKHHHHQQHGGRQRRKPQRQQSKEEELSSRSDRLSMADMADAAVASVGGGNRSSRRSPAGMAGGFDPLLMSRAGSGTPIVETSKQAVGRGPLDTMPDDAYHLSDRGLFNVSAINKRFAGEVVGGKLAGAGIKYDSRQSGISAASAESLRYSSEFDVESLYDPTSTRRSTLLGTGFLMDESFRASKLGAPTGSASSTTPSTYPQQASVHSAPARQRMQPHYGTGAGANYQSMQPAAGGMSSYQDGAYYQQPHASALSTIGSSNPAAARPTRGWSSLAGTRNTLPGQVTTETKSQVTSSTPPKTVHQVAPDLSLRTPKTAESDDEFEWSSGSSYSSESNQATAWFGRFWRKVCAFLNPTPWLLKDVKVGDDGYEYFDDWAGWSPAGFVRHCFYNPLSPEFTSIQQFSWSVVIGIIMGIYTAAWKEIIEFFVDVVWEWIPEKLLEMGVFTELDGAFPLYHYMWITPAIFGGILSYAFLKLEVKIPDQNEWINTVHTRGVIDYQTFWNLFFLSTAGMMSGLSLGPELPLVLTAGMFGSWLGLVSRQSMLQARVMNLTAASAAVGGFFGFPMAGALFVLEIPHRFGLQYFEALSPATFSSIVAVLTNRVVTGNDVTGYFDYPFLTSTLPSIIFTNAIVYGLYGSMIGIGYVLSTKMLKAWVHDIFHPPHDDHHNDATEVEEEEEENVIKPEEKTPLMKVKHARKLKPAGPSLWTRIRKCTCVVIRDEPLRAGLAGAIAGALVGCTCMVYPHVMFWGEAQLQSLIDKGKTPLPVFGRGDEPTAALTALGRCMVDPSDSEAIHKGFDFSCSAEIAIAKAFVTGLSLGTGIVGGHFWGPLFVGCAMSHFFTDAMQWLGKGIGIAVPLGAHPTVVLLCTMGSTHVVAFRAHIAIMLILTLTISAFSPEDSVGGNLTVAGDYSAVFPLLVVSVFVSLIASRKVVFYHTQRSRGDIMAVPEVLCEPGMAGRPLVYNHDDAGMDEEEDPAGGEYLQADVETASSALDGKPDARRMVDAQVTQLDIEREFEQQQMANRAVGSTPAAPAAAEPQTSISPPELIKSRSDFVGPRAGDNSSSRLDELLNTPMDKPPTSQSDAKKQPRHRRIQSAPVRPKDEPSTSTGAAATPTPSPRSEYAKRFAAGGGQASLGLRGNLVALRERTNSGSSQKSLVRVISYGEIAEAQPSLFDQARARAASSDKGHRRVPSLPKARHGRTYSGDADLIIGGSFPPPRHARKESREISPKSTSPLPPHGRRVRVENAHAMPLTNVFDAPPSSGNVPGGLKVDDLNQSFMAQLRENSGN